ncbi:CbtA family protein [Aquibium sp. LZ166]|uniref:CbtA family protein n=1 Tax=Aquibium pacificus TaxID=3153579 RepID=A0ABV3SMD2_9HYPH
MAVFRSAIFLAAIAGLFAGIVMTGLQAVFTVPLILQAETFEGAAAPTDHHHAEATQAAPDDGNHDHGDESWAPTDGAERTFYTGLVNVVTGIGFALLLVAASEIAGGIRSWRAGLVWGFAGFAVFTLAPGLGLPPELPAMPAADLVARQAWWIFTVCATAAGLTLIAFRTAPWLALVGVALIIAPHVIGAPQPASFESPVPESLHHSFVVAVTMTNLVFWLAMGVAVGTLRERFAAGLEAPRHSLA